MTTVMYSDKDLAAMTVEEFSEVMRDLSNVGVAVWNMSVVSRRISTSSLLLISHKATLPHVILRYLASSSQDLSLEEVHAALVKACEVAEEFKKRVSDMEKLQQALTPTAPTLWVD